MGGGGVPISRLHRRGRDVVAIANALLDGVKRLIVFLDGIDEMSRVDYGARISALSDFAGTYRDRVKTIFSCRINDFTLEFVHRQIVLLLSIVRKSETSLRKTMAS